MWILIQVLLQKRAIITSDHDNNSIVKMESSVVFNNTILTYNSNGN